jgi:predicted CoA-binding protein
VLSEPGDTRFQVTLPVDFTAAGATPPAIDLEEDVEDGILDDTKAIAVVGISANPDVAAYSVPRFLQSKGYRIIPVNPKLTEVLGERAIPDLASLPEPVDTVLVFRRATEVPAIVDAAIAAGARFLWLQPGTANEDAVARARRAGLKVVADRCMREARKRLDASRRRKAPPGR